MASDRTILRGMLTATVEKKIDSLPLPFLLVIQLGSNYLGKVSSYDLIQDIKRDILRLTGEVKSQFSFQPWP
jgi:hypothetical protein